MSENKLELLLNENNNVSPVSISFQITVNAHNNVIASDKIGRLITPRGQRLIEDSFDTLSKKKLSELLTLPNIQNEKHKEILNVEEKQNLKIYERKLSKLLTPETQKRILENDLKNVSS